MQIRNSARILILSFLACLLAGVSGVSVANAASPQINLCHAGNYATLSDVLTNAAGVVVRSDTSGTLIGASSPVETDSFLHLGDNLISQQSSSDYVSAMGSLRNTIDSVKSNIMPSATMLTGGSLANEEIIPGQPGVFPAGIYATTAAMSVAASQRVTLTGDANAVFVFISGEAFTLGASVQILLAGGAQAKNVYWIIGTNVGALTVGASSTLVGNYLVDGAMTIGASVQITGRVLARTAMTFGASVHLDSLPPATSCGASLLAPVEVPDIKTIEFTDTTLVDGTIGQLYDDYVAARALINATPDNRVVNYSISPSLAELGLSMSSAGVVSGLVSSEASFGTYWFLVSATSPGYATQTYVYALEIKAAVVVPPVVVPPVVVPPVVVPPVVVSSKLIPTKPIIASIVGGDRSAIVTIATPTSATAQAITGYLFSVDKGVTYQSAVVSGGSFTITGLSNGVSTSVHIRATNFNGNSLASAAKAVVPATTPAAPHITTITHLSGFLTIAFAQPSTGGSALTSHQYSLDGGSTWVVPKTPVKTSPIRVAGLPNATAYQVKIRAVNAKGLGLASDTFFASTPVLVPKAPTYTPIAKSNISFTVKVTAPVDNGGGVITNYAYSIDNGKSWTVVSPASDSTNIVISGLKPNTTYPVQIAAINSAGRGAASAKYLMVTVR